MKRGAFKPFLKHEPPQAFSGKVVDLSAGQPPEAERRIITPEEFAREAEAVDQRGFRGRVGVKADGDLFTKAAQAEIRHVCIRPKETTLRLGPLGVVKLWKLQFVGQGRVWFKPDGQIDLQGIGRLHRVKAPIGTRIGWYLLGAPIFNTRMLLLWLKGKLITQGAIVTR